MSVSFSVKREMLRHFSSFSRVLYCDSQLFSQERNIETFLKFLRSFIVCQSAFQSGCNAVRYSGGRMKNAVYRACPLKARGGADLVHENFILLFLCDALAAKKHT